MSFLAELGALPIKLNIHILLIYNEQKSAGFYQNPALLTNDEH
ncbi:hypothetical protein PCIT_a2637 [Pseudoalteromonas citrea]|uniref:Uncharacterized protein n=1 Tax=Pseudoalteromonas citrea TaxID=43655 RepID=A0AAD4AHC3_9GAMM|nr:hypothetical protein PCIT_a2637 [Pseudoalteromonas citrea]